MYSYPTLQQLLNIILVSIKTSSPQLKELQLFVQNITFILLTKGEES